MYFTDDPVTDYDRYSAQQEKQLEQLPKCSQCGEPIQQEDAVCFNDKYICDRCLGDLRVDLLCHDDL